ncbi:MAG: dicarboxylate/amino acid:cation symporter [Myxococcota bacterium]
MRRLALHHWILLAMVVGAAVGLPLNWAAEQGLVDPSVPRTVADVGREVGDLFLRLLQMIVVPLIVASLVSGVTGLGDLGKLGRMGGGAVAYYATSSLVAIGTGLLFVNAIRPGDAAGPGLLQNGGEGQVVPEVVEGDRPVGRVLWEQLTHMVPENPLAAAAEGDMLPIIFFSILLGVFINVTGGRHARTLSDFFESLFEVMMKMTLFVIGLAPIGVLGFMLDAAAGEGFDAFRALGLYVLTVFLALAFHAVVTLPLVARLVARRSPLAHAKALSPALLTAFSTASSNGTLPLTMHCVEERAGIDSRVSSFVLPLGATLNMDGTALYEAVAVLFIAQVYGSDLALGEQIVVAVTALLVSIGAAGIPHAGTVMMVVVLNAVGLPAEGVGLILAVDRLLDMCRTSVNVWSDAIAAAVVARFLPVVAADDDDGHDDGPRPRARHPTSPRAEGEPELERSESSRGV